MIDELKLHVQGIDMPPPERQKVVSYRPRGWYGSWLLQRSPMRETSYEYRQELGQRLRRTEMANRWADAMSSVWGRWEGFCDKAKQPVDLPFASAPFSQVQLHKDNEAILIDKFPVDQPRRLYRSRVITCLRFSRDATFRNYMLRRWGMLPLTSEGVEIPRR
ncbi:hypothetical protein SARC_03471 [Sphaeroforma arctica JP610]|uniref:Uncharacterized protein n=1 Tax=Sphaeroforma arctica JP610 TaxID=667725 RepID=A0A0L0G5K5_9EUKA|nr:hypothetical protein SARC_03471 [Sphaeroforma arctica JP610]KNC84310.1 hypothetical protein SARC_03471 [Sphaeroforma arctica JP610]|eukprot:XP_014158212.1 hypothetical protein SARC_03471 [Sphaeroforma arctica JP610]